VQQDVRGSIREPQKRARVASLPEIRTGCEWMDWPDFGSLPKLERTLKIMKRLI
jgi:hypothetical protein